MTTFLLKNWEGLGYYSRARNLKKAAGIIEEQYGGRMPDTWEELQMLPGIGGKTAQRLAFHVLELPLEDAQAFADAILEAKRTVHTCPVCQNLTDREICPI